MADCPLCNKLTSNELRVHEFPHSIAYLGPWQYHTGYCVLVSKRHSGELTDLPDCSAFVEEMLTLSRAIEKAFRPRKMNLELLGNQVAHPHWHLFPRRADDPDTLKAVWVGFDKAESDAALKEQLQANNLPREEIIAKIQRQLGA